MQQMFRCHRCGWQNAIGQRFCGSCGENFQYNCPYCNAIVDPAFNTCHNCGAYLTWGFQQPAEPQPEVPGPLYQDQQQFYQQQYQEAPKQKYRKPVPPVTNDREKKKKTNQLIVIVAAAGLLICI